MFREEEPEFNKIFAIEKDKLIHALNGQICRGDDSDPDFLSYVDCPKWEAKEEIINIFDSIMKYAGRSIAIEKGINAFLLENLGPDMYSELMRTVIEQHYIEKEVKELGLSPTINEMWKYNNNN